MPKRKRPIATTGRLLFRLLVALPFSACVALIILEVAARVLPIDAFALDRILVESRADGHRFALHPYSAFIPRPSWAAPEGSKQTMTHNALGFRGAEVPAADGVDRFRIVCLGGSSTYGHTVSGDNAAYPARLQGYLRRSHPNLNVEVINGGAPGYTSFESLGSLATRVVALQPDVVLVYHGINDAHAALYRSLANPEAPVQFDNTHYRNTWQTPTKTSFERMLEGSRAFLVIRRYLTDYATRQADLDESFLVDSDPANHGKFANPDPSPVGFENFERNLRSIVGVAEAHGARVVLATQATNIEKLKDKGIGDPGRAQELAIRRTAEIVRRVGRDLPAVYLADVAIPLESLARESKQAGQEGIFTSAVHFTDRGASLLAALMAKELVGSGFLESGD